jgi:hypothetical protein
MTLPRGHKNKGGIKQFSEKIQVLLFTLNEEDTLNLHLYMCNPTLKPYEDIAKEFNMLWSKIPDKKPWLEKVI